MTEKTLDALDIGEAADDYGRLVVGDFDAKYPGWADDADFTRRLREEFARRAATDEGTAWPEQRALAASATDEGPTRFDVVPPQAPFRILDTPTAEQTATATEAYSRAKCPHNGARNCPACGMKNGYPPDYVARRARPAAPVALDVERLRETWDRVAQDWSPGEAGFFDQFAREYAALSPQEPS